MEITHLNRWIVGVVMVIVSRQGLVAVEVLVGTSRLLHVTLDTEAEL